MAEKKLMTQEDILQLLNTLYDKSVQGIPKVSVPVTQLADDYLTKHTVTADAAHSFIRYQIAKCTTSGFLAGLGGLITLPVSIPANIGSVLYVQLRMIACLAHMGGYDVKSDQVQTLIYACLAGISVDQVVKNVGIKVGVKMAEAAVKKIPGSALVKINQKVGFRLLTKFGTKGMINIGKAIPVVGGIVGGGFDLVETKLIADRAYKMFILDDFSAPVNAAPEDVLELEDFTELSEPAAEE